MKASQYLQFIKSLNERVNVKAAFAFALSWPDQDANLEAWVSNNHVTDLPIEIGKA
jgi:hypothetical protein